MAEARESLKAIAKQGRPLCQILLAIIIATQVNITASAAESLQLRAEVPALDLALAKEASVDSVGSAGSVHTNATTTLNGSIHKTKKSNGNDEQSLSPFADTNSTYSIALKKLSAGLDLTRDEYRSLGIGVLGYENERIFYTKQAKITAVFPGCPIDLSGIEVGDIQLEQYIDDSKVVDSSKPVWMFTCGVEGEAVDLKIKHRGQVSLHHVVRINMEDIPDEKQRLLYEKLVQKMAVGARAMEIDKPENVFSAGN